MSQGLPATSENSLNEDSVRQSVVYTVEQLNGEIRNILENQLGVIWLKAEVSNFKPHSSGHFYFSLKDSKAQISAVMFRGHNAKLKFKPHDGLEVIVRGRITVYEPRGNYQIVCDSMEPVGAGALQKQFEQLKEKLKQEGLFLADKKKPIPTYPQHVAVVTSPTGAAIQDILNIMRRRAKSVKLTVVPALVQGVGATKSLCEAFENAQKINADVIIIGRGGGSIEDLWAFNDETLARLIARSKIPVISAVGHEVDFTICDFVSDLRAPTPSAAAELVAKSSVEINQRLEQFYRLLRLSMEKNLKLKIQNLQLAKRRLIDPKKTLHDFFIKNDELLSRLESSMQTYLLHLKKDIQILEKKLVSPSQTIQKLKSGVDKNLIYLVKHFENHLTRTELVLKNNMAKLNSLSPLAVVERGYSIVMKDNKIIKSVKQIKKSDNIDIRLSDGIVKAELKEV